MERHIKAGGNLCQPLQRSRNPLGTKPQPGNHYSLAARTERDCGGPVSIERHIKAHGNLCQPLHRSRWDLSCSCPPPEGSAGHADL
jgi:hypothetical protein